MSSVECALGGEPDDPIDDIRLPHAVLYDAIDRRLNADDDMVAVVPRADGSISEILCGTIKLVSGEKAIDAMVTLERRTGSVYYPGFLAADVIYEDGGEPRQEEVILTKEPVDPTYIQGDYGEQLKQFAGVVERVKPLPDQTHQYKRLLNQFDNTQVSIVDDGESTSSRSNIWWEPRPLDGDGTAS